MQKISDPYRALGVGRSATEAEIKAAHRKLAKRYHPDGEKGDTTRFLSVQEAYRVLSDPLLRREWDARHAPGPMRADRVERPPRPARPARRAAPQSEAAETSPPPGQPPPANPANPVDPRTAPRSRRAYTWSAAEVPWWEEASTRSERRQPGRRRPRAAADAKPTTEATDTDDQPAPPADEPVFNPTQDFDVYNRSSGAAWSMAARAYFRRGDQDLPRRGSFHHQGTQVLTAARARAAAEQEARRRAAAAATGAAGPAPARPDPTRPDPTRPAAARPAGAASSAAAAGVGAFSGPQPETARQPRATEVREAQRVRQARAAPQHIVRRSMPAPWPTLTQRLVFALVAWLPLVVLAAYGGSVAQNEEIGMLAVIGFGLAVLVAIPRLAYVASVATIGLLIVGGMFIGALAVLDVRLPLSIGLTAAVGAALLLGYVATAGLVALGPPSLRPWATRQPQTVRSR